jgi:hypothetical protein
MLRLSLMLAVLSLLPAAGDVPVLQKKAPGDVDLSAMVKECQRAVTKDHRLTLAWFIPFEFWETTLHQNKGLSAEQSSRFLDVLKAYSTLCVVRADISATGAFTYDERAAIEKAMSVTYAVGGGQHVSLVPVENLDESVSLVFDAMRPILSSAMGKLGGNLQFFVYADRDAKQQRLVAPDVAGGLTIHFADSSPSEGLTLSIPFPIDAFFVPRNCTSCKAALEASWTFCPWDGTKIGS